MYVNVFIYRYFFAGVHGEGVISTAYFRLEPLVLLLDAGRAHVRRNKPSCVEMWSCFQWVPGQPRHFAFVMCMLVASQPSFLPLPVASLEFFLLAVFVFVFVVSRPFSLSLLFFAAAQQHRRALQRGGQRGDVEPRHGGVRQRQDDEEPQLQPLREVHPGMYAVFRTCTTVRESCERTNRRPMYMREVKRSPGRQTQDTSRPPPSLFSISRPPAFLSNLLLVVGSPIRQRASIAQGVAHCALVGGSVGSHRGLSRLS